MTQHLPNSVQAGACTAFQGSARIAAGTVQDVAREVKSVLDSNAQAQVLIFDDETSRVVEVDFRGSVEEVLQRLAAQPGPEASPAESESPRQPGRPKLGVVAREVTLLPRHWEWLGEQPGGASVALRKLVEDAKRANVGKDRVRKVQESAYRFMSAMAGDQPNFEEATRAFFAGDKPRFETLIEAWPVDVKEHTQKISAGAFEA